ncbi:MAG: DAK2 domain-containing protein, partial [Chloroflexota bacterium]
MSESPGPHSAVIPQKWLHCNGQQLKKLFKAGLLWLEHNRERVNALNVFPVPDGDTGTNMVLTMRSAYRRVENSDEMDTGRMAQELAHGALMGARGNSGVILSQIFRGLARSLAGTEMATAQDIAAAFEEAAETAYKGVMRPVEGTILTVVHEGAEEAQDAIAKSSDLRFLLERVLERCQQTLERTPDMLEDLKQAGVVDSGGQGLVYILEGMLRYVYGERLEIAEPVQVQGDAQPPSTPAEQAAVEHVPAQALAAPEAGELEFPYDVQFILTGQGLDVNT